MWYTFNLNFVSEEKENKTEALPKEIMANRQPIEIQEHREPQPGKNKENHN